MAKNKLEIITSEYGSTKTKKIKYSTTSQEKVLVKYSINKSSLESLGEITYGSDVPQPPIPVDQKPVVDAGEYATVIEGQEITLDGSVHDDGDIVRAVWSGPDGIKLTPDAADNTIAKFIAPQIPDGENVLGLIFFFEAEDNKANISKDSCIVTVTKNGEIPPVEPPVEPEDPLVIYDSHINSKLHDGKVRTIKQEGDITPGGMGIECRASGNPRVVVNADGTFSLICDAGHGRIYLYVLNYNATLEVTFAWMNSAANQDCSTKARSQHNEGGACEHRFGGYGLSIDRAGYDSKRETCHNIHDQSKSGSLPSKPETGKFMTLRLTVKDNANGVSQLGELDGKQFMDKIDSSPEAYMIDKASFAKQSYFWIRQNIDSGTGELRIKRIRVLKA